MRLWKVNIMESPPDHKSTTFVTFLWVSLKVIQLFAFFSFGVLMLSIQPIWWDINNMLYQATGIAFNLLLFLTFLDLGLLLLSASFFVIQLKQFLKERTIFRKIGLSILLNFFALLWIVAMPILISEMGNETSIIRYGILALIPWLATILFGGIIVGIQPRIASWWKKSARTKRQALGINVLLVSCLFLSVLATQQFSVGYRMKTAPFLNNPTETTVSISWVSNANSIGWVEFGETISLGSKVYSFTDGLENVDNVHSIRLEDLTPGTIYYYRVVSQKVQQIYPCHAIFGNSLESDIYNFTTLDTEKDAFSFLVFADIHEQEEIYPKILNSDDLTPYDLVFINGDALNHIDSENQLIQEFLNPVTENFASKIPFVFVRGNHETRGGFSRNLKNYISYPNDEFYYSFNHGPVHFTILDTAEDKSDDHQEYSGLVNFTQYRQTETEWLLNEVETPNFQNASFRVVFMHIPPNDYYTSESHPDNLEYMNTWSEIFNASGVDLVISGHYHRFQYIEPNSTTNPYNFPIVLGGGYDVADQALFQFTVNSSSFNIEARLNPGQFDEEVLINQVLSS